MPMASKYQQKLSMKITQNIIKWTATFAFTASSHQQQAKHKTKGKQENIDGGRHEK